MRALSKFMLLCGAVAALTACDGAGGSSGEIDPTVTQKSVIFSMTSCAENSQTSFDWTYAENIGDGRGITFGVVGFTSGTFDGTILLKRIEELDPANVLADYIPAFEAIDALDHGDDGTVDNTDGLDDFIDDFNEHGDDPAVMQAQLEKVDELYWQPALDKARELGVRNAVTLGELYDICVNHGADGDDVDKGLEQLAAMTDEEMGGSPKDGVSELQWLRKLLDVREEYMNGDPTWADAVDRVDMYRRVLASGNYALRVPLHVTCYGDSFTIYGNEIGL